MNNETIHIPFKPLPLQHQCLEYLKRNDINEVLFGGSAGCSKSYTICVWLIMSCISYPGTRYLLGRAVLTILKKSTLNTLFEIIKTWKLHNYIVFDKINNIIRFKNGSEILLFDLYLYPQDPEYNKFGSIEITGAAIDEAAEVSYKVYNIIKTRIRYKLNEYNLTPKILIATNPTKNWCYTNFYLKSKENELEKNKRFIQSFPNHNHYLPKTYIEQLKKIDDNITLQRLYYGNWEYDETALNLFNHERIVESFYSIQKEGEKFLTCDVAMSGKDRTCITLWNGLTCTDIFLYKDMDTIKIVNEIKRLIALNHIKIQNCIVDKVGNGQGVFDLLKGCVGFIGGSSAFNQEPFQNLRTQCYYKLSEMINQGLVSIKTDVINYDMICQELESHKKYKIESDNKSQITPKDRIKQEIGRSPDVADALSMRMFYEYKKRASAPLFV